MTRPEAVVLPFALFGAGLFVPGLRKFSPAQTGVTAAIVVGFAAIPVAVNLYTSHSVLPVTFKGRQFLFANAGGFVTVREHLLAQWLSRPFKTVLLFDGVELSRAGRVAMLLAFVAMAILAAVGLRALLRRRSWLVMAVCAWATVHGLLYAIALPASGHGGRYQPLFLALTLPLPALGLAALLSKQRQWAMTIPAVILVGFGLISLTVWHTVLARGIDHIERTHEATSAWLHSHLAHEPLAAFDIGRIGYDRGTRGETDLVDLGGLTDPRYIDFLTSRQVPRYLTDHHIQYLVLPVDTLGQSTIGQDLGLVGAPHVQRSLLFRACNTAGDWQVAWSETRNAYQCQEVDRVEFAP
jgi:hypothetical protein